jgi:iron complex outermembrane receptor protein
VIVRPPARLTAALFQCLLILTAMSAQAYESIDEIVVTSQRRAQTMVGYAGNIDRVAEAALSRVLHQHIHELLTRVPGVWISRGSGQEHLTAIRSPVLTGAGSCGAFLFLEDGIPIRPSGFCNANQLFEIDTEQAQSIEVIRGPGSALYGSNALHGIINVLMPAPDDRPTTNLRAEIGANEFFRIRAALPADDDSPFLAALLYANDGGFREDSGYRQGKAHLKYNMNLFDGDFTGALSVSDLDQETAGFIIGEDAYKDPDLNRQNLNPEAFRDAESQRLYGLWNRRIGGLNVDIRPYARHSDMRFLQHFLPGQPLEENGHTSLGVLSALGVERENATYVSGLDLEWSDVFLRETQFGPTEGSAFLRETRPEGKHYDYDVVSVAIAAYVQADFEATERMLFSAGLRAEYVHYAYDNRMLDGNTRDDGTACGFGGCLYTRPSDRSDVFTNLAPKLAINYSLSDTAHLYASLARGFRAPQMTELYRLQSGQQVADLDSEEIDSIEVGIRASGKAFSIDTSAFAMNKRNSVIRDADGFNVSNARTRHAGIEATVNWQFGDRWRLKLDATYAEHKYDFDLIAARGESFVSGRDVDTAPRKLGSAELFFDATANLELVAQWSTIGAYYLDAENRFDYDGHDLVNLQGHLTLSRSFGMSLRVNNIFGEDVADRADYAFGNYRYFPGRGREFFLEFRYSASRNESL